ncbi:phosphorylated adapter RNA export protein-like [Argonauta hians]
MAACELEEGELESSDSDNENPVKQTTTQTSSSVARSYQSYVNPAAYRSSRPAARLSSASEEDDSDDEPVSCKKKKKYHSGRQDQPSSMETFSFGHGKNFNFLSANSNPQQQFHFGRQNAKHAETGAKVKKRKNIWDNVLHSQMLSQSFQGFDMEHKQDCYVDRGVESYSYKDKRQWPVEAGDGAGDDGEEMTSNTTTTAAAADGGLFDSVSDLDKLEENFNGVYKRAEKRRRSAKKRLGVRRQQPAEQSSGMKDIDVTAADDEGKVAEAIAIALEEGKAHLIERAVSVLGKEKTLALANMTRAVEDRGGLMTNDGRRRRTPGGVFFQLLKADPEVTKTHLKDIFDDERKGKAKSKKILRAKRFKNKLKKTMEAEMAGGGDGAVAMDGGGGEGGGGGDGMVAEDGGGDGGAVAMDGGGDGGVVAMAAEGIRGGGGGGGGGGAREAGGRPRDLDAALSDNNNNNNSNSNDSCSHSNSSDQSNDPASLDISEMLSRYRQSQIDKEQKAANSGAGQPDKGSLQTAEQKPDDFIYLDEDVDMVFDL